VINPKVADANHAIRDLPRHDHGLAAHHDGGPEDSIAARIEPSRPKVRDALSDLPHYFFLSAEHFL